MEKGGGDRMKDDRHFFDKYSYAQIKLFEGFAITHNVSERSLHELFDSLRDIDRIRREASAADVLRRKAGGTG